MNNAEKGLKKRKQEYDEMVKMALKNNEMAMGKRKKYDHLDSLEVFGKNQ